MFDWLPWPLEWALIIAGMFTVMSYIIWYLWNYRPPWDKDDPKIDHPGK